MEPADNKPVDDKPASDQLVDDRSADDKPVDDKPANDFVTRFFLKSKTGRLVIASYFFFIHVIGMYLLILLYHTSERNLRTLKVSIEVVETMLGVATVFISLKVMLLVGLYYDEHRLMKIYVVLTTFLTFFLMGCGLVAYYSHVTTEFMKFYVIMNVVFNAIPVSAFGVYLEKIKAGNFYLE